LSINGNSRLTFHQNPIETYSPLQSRNTFWNPPMLTFTKWTPMQRPTQMAFGHRLRPPWLQWLEHSITVLESWRYWRTFSRGSIGFALGIRFAAELGCAHVLKNDNKLLTIGFNNKSIAHFLAKHAILNVEGVWIEGIPNIFIHPSVHGLAPLDLWFFYNICFFIKKTNTRNTRQ